MEQLIYFNMETKEIYKRKLIIFLKNKDAYDSFIRQLSSIGVYANELDPLINYCKENHNNIHPFSPSSILKLSFRWRDSLEGFNYWSSLFDELVECQYDIDITDYDLINQPDQWTNMWEE